MLICCGQVVRRWVSSFTSAFPQSGFLFKLLARCVVACLTCIFALGGATIGVISGALKGQTTETGLVRGVGVGAVAGAVTAVQLIELILDGEPFSKPMEAPKGKSCALQLHVMKRLALVCSLVNGKIFMEWVSPAVLKAYQWQINTMETGFREISDIFEVNPIRGLSQDAIQELPSFKFSAAKAFVPCQEASCSICLQDLKHREYTRLLPACRHLFHQYCIDEWLVRQGTCPICRKDV
ncbi:RING/U-box superfamily protein [Striga asiatica]|uniref:RING/U-box superfamily protein n=1 Tax=Striga asiatica TaxID=4170 RepID=A0A5A7PJK1_STRAF|nr:RING/U-box superfamily protein [Striga asiatica]